jgi:hypothetical protein
MKKALLLSIVLVFTLSLIAQTDKLKDAKPFEIKSGKLNIKLKEKQREQKHFGGMTMAGCSTSIKKHLPK